jgi:hypothetical protein
MTANRLLLAVTPILNLGVALGSVATPAVAYLNATSPSRLFARSRMST